MACLHSRSALSLSEDIVLSSAGDGYLPFDGSKGSREWGLIQTQRSYLPSYQCQKLRAWWSDPQNTSVTGLLIPWHELWVNELPIVRGNDKLWTWDIDCAELEPRNLPNILLSARVIQSIGGALRHRFRWPLKDSTPATLYHTTRGQIFGSLLTLVSLRPKSVITQSIHPSLRDHFSIESGGLYIIHRGYLLAGRTGQAKRITKHALRLSDSCPTPRAATASALKGSKPEEHK